MLYPVARLTRPALRAGAIALGLALPATAVHGAQPTWKFSGFGTIGAVHSNLHEADFTSSVLKAGGAGRTHPWSMDVDTRLGAQLDVALDRRWSAVLQVVSEQRLDNSYRPAVEWANVKYQATPDLALRVGRIALPMFLAADYRKVGYVYPWVRPPVEVYGSMPLASSDGADLAWRWCAGSLRNATQAFYGRADIGLVGQSRLRARGIAGVSDTADYDAFSARVSVISAELTLDVGRDLFGGFAAFGPQGRALAGRYDADHKRATVASAGISYDPGHWFIMAEASRTRTDSFLGKTSTLYTSAGYRWRAFTPYLGYARVTAGIPLHDAGLALAGLPQPLATVGAGLNGGLNALLKTVPVQSTISAGARWDLRRDLALKLQYDRVTPRDGSRGALINTDRTFVSGTTAQVASVALDFVF